MRAFTILVVMGMSWSATAGAQQWNDARALSLVQLATERRAQQFADSGLIDYRAVAHGYVTFLAQLGEGFREPPKVVKADELALQVYWRTPNLSKQHIVGRRDTTLLPTDIQYHRDHLGIIQNNFPAIIRLGDGDEVQDVPHPLSPDGLGQYEFALTDSLRITIPGRVIGVYEIKVRPRDDREPRVIGAIYLDRDNAQVVRMALSFTRAAFLDRQLEDLFVVLENGLVGTQFWLPRRQEIEIRRTATWLDYPARGIIRGRWEIGEYELNQGIPFQTFAGSEIVNAPEAVRRGHTWPSANILDSLPPDIRAVTADEVRRVQAEVRALVREQALRRARGTVLAARGISDFVRFNRVEGVALGAGVSFQAGHGLSVSARARHGLEDERTKSRFELTWQNAAGTAVRAYYLNDFADVGDVAERSLVANSLAAQESGSDHTDPYAVEVAGGGGLLFIHGARVSLDLTRERHRALQVHAAPASGRFEAPVSAAPLSVWRVVAALDRPTSLGWLGTEFRWNAALRASAWDEVPVRACGVGPCLGTTSTRGSLTIEIERPIGDMRVSSRTFAAMVVGSAAVPAQDLVFLGGAVSAPGYAYHSLVGDRAASQGIAWQFPVPFPAIPLGRFGKAPGRAMVAPHASVAWLHQPDSDLTILRGSVPFSPPDPLRPRATGLYPAVGISAVLLFDLLRFDLSRGLRDGRWMFSVDFARSFWSIM